MTENWFGEDVAARYDDDEELFRPEVVDPVVDVLTELAGDGAALELGIGTGRIAVPLAARGVPVHGIDLSEEMLTRLRAKPGAEGIGVTVGDFATARVDRRFRLVFLVFNTISNLTTQDAQVACFENAAARLEPGGCFVIENEVPPLQRLPAGERYVPFDVSDEHLGFDELDVATQRLVSHHWTKLRDGSWTQVSVPFRYTWPAELDLMARIAGLRLRERWADWDRSPYGSESRKHVSVWEKPVEGR